MNIDKYTTLIRQPIKLQRENSPVKLTGKIVAINLDSGECQVHLDSETASCGSVLNLKPHYDANGRTTSLLLDSDGRYWKVL